MTNTVITLANGRKLRARLGATISGVPCARVSKTAARRAKVLPSDIPALPGFNRFVSYHGEGDLLAICTKSTQVPARA